MGASRAPCRNESGQYVESVLAEKGRQTGSTRGPRKANFHEGKRSRFDQGLNPDENPVLGHFRAALK